jgi:threonine dehydrogenase-like Zn-dependent dehydrogenase
VLVGSEQAMQQALASVGWIGRVVLVGLRPSGSQPVRKAEVTFRSHQAAGYGPSDAPNATCTNWDITYALTQPAGQYLIDKVISATDSGC